MSLEVRIAAVLMDIESQLRQLQLWETLPPPVAALASEQPFCIDTLTLPQWLQFVFLPRMYALMEAGDALPAKCGIAPMAEEYFSESGLTSRDLVAALLRVDEILSSERH